MKLYVALLDTLGAGQRVAQAMHGVAEFAAVHPEALGAWRAASNTVVAVAMPARDLAQLAAVAEDHGAPSARFREPDQGDALTAVAVLPTAARVRRFLQHAPLA